MERYSPVFVYGNVAYEWQNICACLEIQDNKLNYVGHLKGKMNCMLAPNRPLCGKLIWVNLRTKQPHVGKHTTL